MVGALEAGGASVAPLGPAEKALLLGLNLVGHSLRVGGASVVLLGTSTAPQLVPDYTPNRHGPRLVDNVAGEADVIPPAPPPSQIWAVREPEGRVVEGKGRVVEGVGQQILVAVRTGNVVGQFLNAAKRCCLRIA
jgi:hypothetical protein